MHVNDLERLLEGAFVEGTFAGNPPDDGEILSGYTSDLMSDVMGHAPQGAVLITVQAHRNTVAVAGLVGARAIVICNGRPVPDDMRSAAAEEKIPLFATGLNAFEVSGRVYRALERD